MRVRLAVFAMMTCVVMARMTLDLHAADKWIEVKSAHFLVVSNDSQSSARTLAWQLEQIRSAIAGLWPWAQVDLNKPLTVIAVKDEPSMKTLVPKYWEQKGGVRPGSVWMSGPDQYYLAIRTDQRVEESQNINPHITAYFSYVSLVLQQSVEHDLPPWFSRGLSGVLSNTIVRDTDLLLGPPIPWELERLREGTRLPLPVMVKVTESSPELKSDEGLSRFDAEAWALVHFLMFGERGVHWTAFDKFAKLVAGGTDAEMAFREALGRPEDLQLPMATYINQPLFSYRRINIDVSVEREKFPFRPLPPAESASVRALFHTAMNRPIEAHAAIDDARKAGAAPDSFVAEALLLDRDGKKEEAIAAYTRAVDAGSKSPYAHYRLAVLLWSPQADHDLLARIEKHLAASIALNTRQADGYAFLGEIRSLLGSGEPLALVRRAIALDPSEPRHHLTAARVLWRQQKYDEALKDAQAALALARDEDDRRAAREMVDSIERARKNR